MHGDRKCTLSPVDDHFMTDVLMTSLNSCSLKRSCIVHGEKNLITTMIAICRVYRIGTSSCGKAVKMKNVGPALGLRD